MSNRREFEIAYVGLKPGVHEFIYTIDDRFFEVCYLQDNWLYEKSQSNLIEMNARGAHAIVITDTANGDQRLVKAKDIATDPLSAELSKQLRMGKSGTIESGGKKLFLNVYAPRIEGPEGQLVVDTADGVRAFRDGSLIFAGASP